VTATSSSRGRDGQSCESGQASTEERRLAAFAVGGLEREVVALGDGPLRLVDRIAATGGDGREVEPRIPSLPEAEALARDYAWLSRQLGRSAMPEPWW
jgi:hypothetical protein